MKKDWSKQIQFPGLFFLYLFGGARWGPTFFGLADDDVDIQLASFTSKPGRNVW